MNDPVEIELKLELEPVDLDAVDRAALFGAEKDRRQLRSVYFDTPDLAVHRAGYTLRIRKGGQGLIQTIKAERGGQAGLFSRSEWEMPVEAEKPILAADGPLAALLEPDEIAGLQPVFWTDVERSIHAIESDGAIIEVAIDRGEVATVNTRLPLCEVEMELRRGPPQALFDLARRLGEVCPFWVGALSKAERGYALAEEWPPKSWKAKPVVLEPGWTAGDAFVAIAHSCLAQFRLNQDLLLMTGAAEPLHQARVGLRRLRSAFSLCRQLFEGDPKVGQLRDELKWLAARLGEVRNIDVLIARLSEGDDDQLGALREDIYAQVKQDLLSPRTRGLMIDLVEWLETGDWRHDPADPSRLGQPVADFAADLLDRHRRRMKRRGRNLASLSDEDRHEARIEGKKLRYAVEFFASLYSEGKAKRRMKQFRRPLEELQELLGELNDLVTGNDVLQSHGLGIALPKPPKHRWRQLLKAAEDVHDELMDARRFWR